MKSLLQLIVAIILMVAFTVQAFSQPPDTLWTGTYGGSGYDQGNSIQQTADGGYIMTGYTSSFGAGNLDVYLIKTDLTGTVEWTKTYGGVHGDEGNSVQQTTDGGYIIVGSTSSYGLGTQVYLIKTDSLGDTLWTRIYGGGFYSIGYCVQQTTDEGYIITGRIDSYGPGYGDVYLIKTDSLGDTLWTKTFGGSGFDQGKSVQQTTDGGYIITGSTDSYGAGYTDVYLIKTDALGNQVWQQTFGGSDYDRSYCVQQIATGGYIIVGSTSSYGLGTQVYLIKTDSSGDTLWTNLYGDGSNNSGSCVQWTSDGGYIIVGKTYSYGLGTQAYLIKTDSSGDTIWTKTFGESISQGRCVQQTADGGYVVVGYTYSNGAEKDFYIIRLGAETIGVKPFQTTVPLEFILYPTYPNPFNPTTNINYALPEAGNVNLTVYDISGRQVAELVNSSREAGTHSVTFDGSNLASGVYFYLLKTGNNTAIGKMLMVK